MALVIVKAKKGANGKFTVKAESNGLDTASIVIESKYGRCESLRKSFSIERLFCLRRAF
jgi:hypothetical protein